MLVSVSVPNLTTGVSQQPPSMRLVGAAEQMVNSWTSIVTGLNKRPPTEYIAKFANSVSSSAIGHVIDRDDANRFIVTIADNNLRVFGVDGSEKTVSFPEGKQYLIEPDAIDTFRFMTIQDTTFILNRNTTILADEFGETGDITGLTLDGTVANDAALPVASVTYVNQKYFVTLTSKYKQCQLTSGRPEIDSWVYQRAAGYPDTTDTVVSTLPNPVPAVGTYVWVYAPDRGLYYLYKVQVTQTALTPVYAWVEVSPANLVTSVGDRLNPDFLGTVYVQNSVSNSNYSVYINGSLKANYLSPTGTDASTSVPGTSQIASSIASALTGAGVACSQHGSTILISGLARDDTLVVNGTQGDKAIKCYRQEIASFSDLPPTEAEGRIVKVKGSPTDTGDDYYVIYQKGVWVETSGYADSGGLQASTMPHKLVKNLDGTFTFSSHTWETRGAGDSVSNPQPSFVNDKLQDMFLFTNRMGFVTNSNVILSEANKFENYYRTTLATLLDSDRLDLSVLSAMNDNIRHAVPFNKDLLIMADKTQHRFTYNNFVGPKNVQVQFTTAFNCAPNVRPVNMGSSIYFLDDKNGYTYGKMFEYFPKPNLTGDDADETTAPVPEFITTGVRILTGSPRVGTVVVGTDGAPNTLFVYKYFWAQDKKVQSAWSTWTFPDVVKILWAEFSRNFLYLLVSRSDGVFLERIRIDEDLYDPVLGSRVMLDRLTAPTAISYDAVSDTTTLGTPYATDTPVDVVVDDGTGKRWAPAVRYDASTCKVEGDVTGATVWIGLPYEWLFQFSTPYVSWTRYPKGTGEVISMDGRLQMRHVNIDYHNTPYFKVKLTQANRPEKVVIFDRPTGSGVQRIPILCSHQEMKLKLTNDGPFNCSFGVAEWWAIYSPKSKRMP